MSLTYTLSLFNKLSLRRSKSLVIPKSCVQSGSLQHFTFQDEFKPVLEKTEVYEVLPRVFRKREFLIHRKSSCNELYDKNSSIQSKKARFIYRYIRQKLQKYRGGTVCDARSEPVCIHQEVQRYRRFVHFPCPVFLDSKRKRKGPEFHFS